MTPPGLESKPATPAGDPTNPFNGKNVGMTPTISKLAEALANAQGEIKTAATNANNPHFKKDFADLSDVRDACRDALKRNGLSVPQIPFAENNTVVLRSILLHSSGEYLWGDLIANVDWKNPQTVGSAITYLRRYALSAYTGVAPKGEDDDGEGANGRGNQGGGGNGGNSQGSGNGNSGKGAPPAGKSQGQRPPQTTSAAPAEPPPIPELVKPYADRFDALQPGEIGVAEFHKILSSSRDLFPDDGPEKRAYGAAVKRAAARLGIQKKPAEPTS